MNVNNNKKKQAACPICTKPMADNRFCFNSDCRAYDPLSQYFVAPTDEDLQKDAESIQKRLREIDDAPLKEGTLPF